VEAVRLCLVVPCYNEEDALPAFFQRVIPALDAETSGRWRLLCVDDGSRDRTFDLIAQQHVLDRRVEGIRLSRNFGHQPAVSVGLAFARGEYVGVIDADLQDPIDVLIELYRKALRENLDVCYGVRGRREAPIFLRFAYSLFYRVIDVLADHDWPRDTGDFCVMSARCHRVLVSLPEHSRMMRGLRAWVGFRQAGLRYDRPARLHGQTKYNLRRLCALALQGMVAFSSIPLRIASLIGAVMAVLSMLFAALIVVNRLVPRFSVLGYWVGANRGLATLLVFVAFITSMMFLCLGIVGEYLIVMFRELKRRPTAIVGEVLGSVRKNELATHVSTDAINTPRQDFASGGNR
jgi:polyisoprenyl-phosphate glycosyltransferase